MLEPALAGFGKMYMYRGMGAGGWLWSKRQSLNDRPGIGTAMIDGRVRTGSAGIKPGSATLDGHWSPSLAL